MTQKITAEDVRSCNAIWSGRIHPGANVKEIRLQTSERICEIYELYKAGEISQKEWATYIVMLLMNYIKSRIKAKGRIRSGKGLDITSSPEYEDLVTQGVLAIMDNIERYVPYRAMPSSFFTLYIDQYQKDIARNDGKTQYYVAMAVKLNKVAKSYGFSDITDEKLKPDTLAVLADTSLETVLRTIESQRVTVCSIDECKEVQERIYGSPENALIRKEQSMAMEAALDNLSPYHRHLVLNHASGVDYMTTFKELNTAGARLEFEIPSCKRLNVAVIKNDTGQAITALRHNSGLRDAWRCNTESPYEQTSDGDMEELLLTENFMPSDITDF